MLSSKGRWPYPESAACSNAPDRYSKNPDGEADSHQLEGRKDVHQMTHDQRANTVANCSVHSTAKSDHTNEPQRQPKHHEQQTTAKSNVKGTSAPRRQQRTDER